TPRERALDLLLRRTLGNLLRDLASRIALDEPREARADPGGQRGVHERHRYGVHEAEAAQIVLVRDAGLFQRHPHRAYVLDVTRERCAERRTGYRARRTQERSGNATNRTADHGRERRRYALTHGIRCPACGIFRVVDVEQAGDGRLPGFACLTAVLG